MLTRLTCVVPAGQRSTARHGGCREGRQGGKAEEGEGEGGEGGEKHGESSPSKVCEGSVQGRGRAVSQAGAGAVFPGRMVTVKRG